MRSIGSFENYRIDASLLPHHIRSPEESSKDIDQEIDWKKGFQLDQLKYRVELRICYITAGNPFRNTV